MGSRPGEGLIHEVTFFTDADAQAGFAEWLEEATRKILAEPGVTDVRSFTRPDDEAGRRVVVCQVALSADAAIDPLLASGTIFDEADLAERFGDAVEYDARLLREDPLYDTPAGESPWCLNCGSRLRGQYCGQCGQRAKSRLISLWELVSDAFGDLFELDSRIWRTLIPLVTRPGRLTDDYLQGRRARFMPPFRMYLVLSLLFFVIAFTDPREKLGILFEAPPADTVVTEPAGDTDGALTGDGAAAPGDAGEAERLREEILADLAREGVITEEDAAESSGSVRIGIEEGSSDLRCDVTASDLEDLPEFLARRLTVERLKHVCEQFRLDDGRAFFDGVLNAIPTALIVLLPVMAFVLKALYPLSRRYYVEHLLFFVHFHAFFFLILTLQIVFSRLATWAGLPDTARVLTLVATSLYIPVYLFVAMRRVYGQGRFITALKFIVLLTAYFVGFTLTMATVALIVAFSL